jgi:T-complex protein 1 subunit alpha
MIKSSLGPVGLDKMLVDDIGDVTITNDGATILQQLEVEHPAARLLVDLAAMQDVRTMLYFALKLVIEEE